MESPLKRAKALLATVLAGWRSPGAEAISALEEVCEIVAQNHCLLHRLSATRDRSELSSRAMEEALERLGSSTPPVHADELLDEIERATNRAAARLYREQRRRRALDSELHSLHSPEGPSTEFLDLESVLQALVSDVLERLKREHPRYHAVIEELLHSDAPLDVARTDRRALQVLRQALLESLRSLAARAGRDDRELVSSLLQILDDATPKKRYSRNLESLLRALRARESPDRE